MGNEIIIATNEVKFEFHFFWKEECLCIIMNKCTHAYAHTQNAHTKKNGCHTFTYLFW